MTQTSKTEINRDRFLDIVEAYGAEPARWPEAERGAALAFAEAHPEIAEPLLDEARALDALLGPAEAEAGDLLQARLLAALPAAEPGGAVRRPTAPVTAARIGWSGWRAPFAAAAALVIGVAIGFASGALTGAPESEESYEYFAFSSLEEDWIDWFEADA